METDYLVIGAGASALSFVDTMLDETDADFVMIDRRPAPGGHWNDSYPFVRLHQPACTYGVASRALGRNRIETRGTNRGLLELSSGTEVTSYFHTLMQDRLLPSERVRFFPLAEQDGATSFISRFSGERHEVTARRAVVEGTHLHTQIPLTHVRKFTVAEGVRCEPVNLLPRLVPEYRHVTVLGAGKTGIDAVVWLLENGWPDDALRWIVPRDGWYWNRDRLQPGGAFFERTMDAMASQNEACAAATDVDDLCRRQEENGMWTRLDGDVWPSLYHAATVSSMELESLRRVRDVVRLGRVSHIDPDRIVLTGGEIDGIEGSLYVDCTASAAELNIGDTTPVFRPGHIALQMIRLYQPCFSSALIAHMVARGENETTNAPGTDITPMTDTVEDWVHSQAVSLRNQIAWNGDDELSDWISGCRLDPFFHTGPELDLSDPGVGALLGRMQSSMEHAAANLERLGALSEASVTPGR